MDFTALLFCGGESRRMGRDKATLLWHGRQLWAWQLDKLRALQPNKILLSARSDPAWRPEDVEVVLDDPPSRGPLGGLRAGLARMETSYLLALAVDLPFMTTEYLMSLCERVGAGTGIVPVIEGHFQPLVAIYPKEINLLGSGSDFSLQPIIRRLIAQNKMRPIQIPANETSLYLNMNTPTDVPEDIGED